MNPADREPLVQELMKKVTTIMRETGPLTGEALFSLLTEKTGRSRGDVSLVLGRVPVRILPNGLITLK